MKSGILSRADLLQALQKEDHRIIKRVADELGLQTLNKTKKTPVEVTPKIVWEEEKKENTPILVRKPIKPLTFWKVVIFEQHDKPSEPPKQTLEKKPVEWTNRPPVPTFQPLSSHPALQPRLHKVLNHQQWSHQLDITKIVQQMGKAQYLKRIPYQTRRSWGRQIQIIDDRSLHLVPYWKDHQYFMHWINARYPAYAWQYAFFNETFQSPRLRGRNQGDSPYQAPPSGTVIMILSDLGTLLQSSSESERCWLRLGRLLKQAGHRALVLMPNRLPQTHIFHSYYNLLSWHKDENEGQNSKQAVQHLLSLVSPAIRIEPELLRMIRKTTIYANNAGFESLVWQHPALSSRSSVAATLHHEVIEAWRKTFIEQTADLQKKALTCIRQWRSALPSEIWFEELLSLPETVRKQYIKREDIEQGIAFFKQLSQKICVTADDSSKSGATAWFMRAEKRLAKTLWEEEILRHALQNLSWCLHKDETDYQPRHALDNRVLQAEDLPLQTRYIHQCGQYFMISKEIKEENGSPIARINYRKPWLNYSIGSSGKLQSVNLNHLNEEKKRITLPDPRQKKIKIWSDYQSLILKTDALSLENNAWADAMGRDEYGLWAEIKIKGASDTVTQKLRWIPPGVFEMGSMPSENDVFSSAKPQHSVIISQGYWLFATQVTQQLWQIVMPGNPSHLKNPSHPVENMTWDKAMRFIDKLNKTTQLGLSLPTEAQWEYACRANTNTPTYGVLEDIAWYTKNSDKKTHPVGLKSANAWGLYDMLGNVEEWCKDDLGDYSLEAQKDPVGSSTQRVLRGGSFAYSAATVRASYRYRIDVDYRFRNIGFRCARVQV